MRAQQYAHYGDPADPGTLELVDDRPTPKVPPGFALVRVVTAGVNPVDWKIVSGGLDPIYDAVLPAVPGWDVAGVVERLGADVENVAVGDEVLAYARTAWIHHGTFAEFVPVPADLLARKPTTLEWDQAGALPLAGLTAYQTLTRLGTRPDTTVLIHNASGGVGSFAVQIARHLGARVIGTASRQHHDRLRSLGAEPVEYGDGLVDRVRALAPGGVDVVLDLVGGVLDDTLAILAPGGTHGSIADPRVLEAGGKYLWVRPSGQQLTQLVGLVESGDVRIDVTAEFPLDRLTDAFALSMEGHTAGKIVIRVS